MKLPSRPRQILLAKLVVVLGCEVAICAPFLASALWPGGTPELALQAQSWLRQRAIAWLFPHARG
jgi:hypothetical protein